MKTAAKIIILALFFSACASTDTSDSKNVNQDEIWQHYWVDYDEAGENLTAGCTFRFGGSTGTTLKLVEPSKVFFEGHELDYSTAVLIKGVIGGTHYNYEGRGDYKGKYTFEYTNNNGNTFTNSISLQAPKVDSVPETLNAAANNAIAFNDKDIDGISIKFTNATGATVTIDDLKTSHPIKGKSTINLPREKLKELGDGPVTITFTKYKRMDNLQQGGHLGGSIAINYTTKQYQSNIINAGKGAVEKQDTVAKTNK